MAVSRDAFAICEHSLKYRVTCSWPKIFSVRSLSSSPPSQISDPFGSITNQSVLSILYATSGKHNCMTLGSVSIPIDIFTELKRYRNIACLDPCAVNARIIIALTIRNVFPLRLPPNSIMLVAGPASIALASTCLSVSLNSGIAHSIQCRMITDEYIQMPRNVIRTFAVPPVPNRADVDPVIASQCSSCDVQFFQLFVHFAPFCREWRYSLGITAIFEATESPLRDFSTLGNTLAYPISRVNYRSLSISDMTRLIAGMSSAPPTASFSLYFFGLSFDATHLRASICKRVFAASAGSALSAIAMISSA